MTIQTAINSNPEPSITAAWKSSDVAQRYKAAENATRPFAVIMLDEIGLADTVSTKAVNIFDLACGTGALEAEIYTAIEKDKWSNVGILAGDISQPMLDYLSQRGQSEGWTGLQTRVVDGKNLEASGVGDGFSHVFVGFGIFVLPPDTLKNLSGAVQNGSVVGVSTWANLPWYGLLERTYERMLEGPVLPSEAQLGAAFTNGQAWNNARFVEAQFEEAGLRAVKSVQRRISVDCGTPEVFMTTMGFVLGMLSKQWDRGVRDRWMTEVGETMKGILVEEAGGEGEHVFMTFEAIVGVGWKGE